MICVTPCNEGGSFRAPDIGNRWAMKPGHTPISVISHPDNHQPRSLPGTDKGFLRASTGHQEPYVEGLRTQIITHTFWWVRQAPNQLS